MTATGIRLRQFANVAMILFLAALYLALGLRLPPRGSDPEPRGGGSEVVRMGSGSPLVDADLLVTLARTSLEAGRFEEAIGAFHRALALSPDDPRIHADLGRAYLAATDPAAAIAPLEEARRRTAEISRAVLDLARAYEALGRRAEAMQAYRDYLSSTEGEGETAGRQQAAAGLKRVGVAQP